MSKGPAFLLFVALLIQSACQNAAPPVSISKQPVSVNNVRQPNSPKKPVEEMSWTSMNGGEQRIGDLRDKVLILDFWATYCPPCREEIPHLNSLQAKYGTNKLQIVGLNVGGDEDQPKIPAFARQMKVSYPIAFPEQPLVDYVFGDDDSIPQTVVFDRRGQVLLKVTGFGPEIKDQLDDAVESAIQQ
jgi:thiol-disulfide isomerase/thioredoxin